jgi:hypothetical protein
MNKAIKITLNTLLFLLIAGFGTYMIYSMISQDDAPQGGVGTDEKGVVSPYKQVGRFDTPSPIRSFYIHHDTIYTALSDRVSLFDLQGKQLSDFEISSHARDMVVEGHTLYLLFPAHIELYSLEGAKRGEWAACSENSDYYSLTVTEEYVFVTDAANKLIWQLNKQGQLIRYIKSPQGFIIPSTSFDIIHIRDTLYCVNSGRHQIESYTLDGAFIASFGVAGAQAGAFAGCCNPSYLAPSAQGHILTSEKGAPRISCYGTDGRFRTILFDSHALGGGSTAFQMQTYGEKMVLANKRTILVYRIDPTLSGGSCMGCEAECPLRR